MWPHTHRIPNGSNRRSDLPQPISVVLDTKIALQKKVAFRPVPANHPICHHAIMPFDEDEPPENFHMTTSVPRMSQGLGANAAFSYDGPMHLNFGEY